MGRERESEEVLDLARARALAATLDRDPDALREGDPLPCAWHWIYFHETARRSELADDGHARRGDFLPPIPLDRRMWAGGRVRFLRAPRIGTRVRRTSTVEQVTLKEGRSGPLGFVTVRHRMRDSDGGLLIDEEQDIVYLDRDGGRAATASIPAMDDPAWREELSTDEAMLFRFSALTFNGHRIHYDHPWATAVEGYPGLVVHGPLIALLAVDAGLRHAPGRASAPSPVARPPARDPLPLRLEYRARQPVFCGEALQLLGRTTGPEAPDVAWAQEVELVHPERGLATRARISRILPDRPRP